MSETSTQGSPWQRYRRTQIAEMRPVTEEEARTKKFVDSVSVSGPDVKNGSPLLGDYVARNPKNHADQWLVAAQYFADNFEPMEKSSDG